MGSGAGEEGGEVADGIILTRSTLRSAASLRAQLAEAARQAGRNPAKIARSPRYCRRVLDDRFISGFALAGTAEQDIAQAAQYRRAGADELAIGVRR